MVATTRPRPERVRVQRFARAVRVLHWTNATLFVVLLFTAAVLYVGPLSGAVGRRELIRQIHVYTGLALPVPFLLAYAGRWRTSVRADVRALNRWDAHDRRWMRTFGRDPFVRLGKFNAGQKLNAAFVAGAIPVMLGTGSIMHWFRYFPVDWRTGATFMHDWIDIALFFMIFGHIVKALAEPDALRGMVRGWVWADWARNRRPRWYEEVQGAEATPRPVQEAAEAR